MLQRITRRTDEVLRFTGSSTFFHRQVLLTPGLVQQFPVSGLPASLINGPGQQTIWFNNAPNLGIFNPATSTIQNVSTPATGMEQIVLGPDGNVYYGTAATSNGGAGVGWANATGNLGFVSTPGWAVDLAAGLDRVWFSQMQGQNAAGWIFINDHSVGYLQTRFATLAPLATSNNSVWFGEFGRALAFIDPNGNLTEYTTQAQAITQPLGYDGSSNFWFGTDLTIGFISPAGAVQEFDIGGNGAFAILFNADGTVWFASSFSQQIGLLDPSSGNVTWFNLSGLPAGLVFGSDGNPWFTEFGPQVGTIRNGQVLEFATQGAQPYPPILGSDGNVYYGDGGDGSVLTNRYIGNVTPDGVVTEWQTNGLPNSLMEFDGWIYFGENAPRFGRVFVGSSVVR